MWLQNVPLSEEKQADMINDWLDAIPVRDGGGVMATLPLWLERFPPLLWLVGIHMRTFWGGAKLLQRFVVVLGALSMGFPVKFSEISIGKTILSINFYFLTEDEKWKGENGIIPVITKLTKDGLSINQSTVPEPIEDFSS